MVMRNIRTMKKRRIPVFNIYIEPGADYDRLIEIPEIKEIVIDELLIALDEAVNKRKKSINLFEITNSGYYIELKKTEYKTSLEKVLAHFIEKEEYDKCAKCRDLINKL